MKISCRDQVVDLLKILGNHNFFVTGIDDGGHLHLGGNKNSELGFEHMLESEVIDVCLSVDECKVYVIDGDNLCPTWLYLVWGNDPGELVCDYMIPKDLSSKTKLDKATSEYFDYYDIIESDYGDSIV